jgi:hypothetical protein
MVFVFLGSLRYIRDNWQCILINHIYYTQCDEMEISCTLLDLFQAHMREKNGAGEMCYLCTCMHI